MSDKRLRKFIEHLVERSKKEASETGKSVKEVMIENLRYVTSLSKMGVSSDMVRNEHKTTKKLLEEAAQ